MPRQVQADFGNDEGITREQLRTSHHLVELGSKSLRVDASRQLHRREVAL